MASSRTPRSADPLGAVDRFLATVDLRGKRLVAGLSGGMDSVVLLDVLRRLESKHGYALRALHVHHGLSPNADRWAHFCARLCRRWEVPMSTRRVKVDGARGQGFEGAARAARQGAFRLAPGDALALAHHLDDQAETVLLALLRGAGVRGASAMGAKGRLGSLCVLRPLLEVPRAELNAYAAARGLKWVEDESNQDDSLARGYLRTRVLPEIEARYPRWREALARAAGHFAEADALLRSRIGSTSRLTVSALRASGVTARLRLRDFLAAHGLRAPSARRLAEMLRQVCSAPQDARTEIVHDGMALRVYRGELLLERKSPEQEFEPRVWAGESRLDLPSLEGELRFRRVLGEGIDPARLSGRPVLVRLRRGGERLQTHPKRPRRPLKDLFQEAGVPPWRRARLPLLFCGDDLVWAPGLGVDAAYRARAAHRGIVPEWRSRAH